MISTDPIVRPAHESDLEQIVPLFVHSLDTSLPGVTFSSDPEYALDKITSRLASRLFPPHSHKTYVLELHTGEIIAYGNVKPNGGPKDKSDADELDMFFVQAGLGGRGYGGQLMEAIQKDWSEGGLWLRVFERNERARRFYEKYGFRVVEGAEERIQRSLSGRVREERVLLMRWTRTS